MTTTTRAPRVGSGWLAAWNLAAAASVAAAAATLAGVAFTGAAAPSLLVDTGPVVRWGLPVVTALCDLAAAVTIGALVLTCVALPVGQSKRPPRSQRVPAGHQVRQRDAAHPYPHIRRPLALPEAFGLVTAAAAVWAGLTVVRAAFAYSDVSGRSLSDPNFGSELAYFLRNLDLGRGFLTTVIVAALVSIFAAGATTLRAAGLLTLLSMVGLIPPALAGHSADAGSHETAVTALGLHLLGVCVWAGGLLALVALRATLTQQPGAAGLSTAAGRYSPLAFWSVVLVAGSGVINAALRLGSIEALTTSYGLLVLVKTAALVGLGAVGWWHRKHTLVDLAAGRPHAFLRLAAGEVVVMAATIGVGAALARTAPPVSDDGLRTPTLAESVTGYPMPDPPSIERYFTLWQPDLLWVLICGLMAGLYIAGLVRLRRRGDRWSAGRTIPWMLGVAVVFYMTSGAPMAYGRVLFSAHMFSHMTLSMAAPILLVLGAPITLALRALHPRHDGSRGPREWLIAVTESRYMAFLTRPVVAAFLFAGSLVLFYYSVLFEVALTTHVGHELMHVHFLFAGYVFSWVLIGIDPGPHRPSYPMRLLLLFATMAFHAFFALSLMMATTVLQAEYFGGLGRAWGRSLLEDQRLGGGLTWGIGEIPTLILAIVLAIQWAMSDDREARRADRRADRDNDAELRAYNEMLAGLAAQDTAAARDTKRT